MASGHFDINCRLEASDLVSKRQTLEHGTEIENTEGLIMIMRSWGGHAKSTTNGQLVYYKTSTVACLNVTPLSN